MIKITPTKSLLHTTSASYRIFKKKQIFFATFPPTKLEQIREMFGPVKLGI